MGYKCDVCSVEDAAIFCFADQAVVCTACDARIHNANKVVMKHERVTLCRNNEPATCDICQENKALMFCSEDRALICRRCDLMIHTANEFVAKHSRYLLSGVTVGLKSVGVGSPDDEHIEAHNKKPYSLRNSAMSGVGREKQPWKSAASDQQLSSRIAKQPEGMPVNTVLGKNNDSQASLLTMGNPSGLSTSTPVGTLTGASLITPFGTTEEQARRDSESSPSHSPARGGSNGAGPSNIWGSWGGDSLELRPNSTDFTLAAELLGMPSVSQGFSAKDVDAAYIFDDDDLEANLSALLEVPDLELLQNSNPTVANFRASDAVPGVSQHAKYFSVKLISGKRENNISLQYVNSKIKCSATSKFVAAIRSGGKQSSPSDGVVPDFKHKELKGDFGGRSTIGGDLGNVKRQRIES